MRLRKLFLAVASALLVGGVPIGFAQNPGLSPPPKNPLVYVGPIVQTSTRVHSITQHGKVYRFGRKHSPPRRKLHFSDYANLGALPPPPPMIDYSAKAPKSVASVYLNDQLGDCVIADNARFVGIATGNSATEFIYTNAMTTTDYSAIGGYVPGDPSTDNGCDPEAALSYYQKHGYADGSKLACWFAIDATNTVLCQQAEYLFESLAVAMDLPDAWTANMPQGDGFVWDKAGPPNANQGHEFSIIGFDPSGFIIDSWGLKGHLTYEAAAYYCVPARDGNIYGRVSPDQIVKATSLAPNGLNWSQLITDADAMGGTAPIPAPVPTPVPIPTPVIPPTPYNPVSDLISYEYNAANGVYVVILPQARKWTILDNQNGVITPFVTPSPGISTTVPKSMIQSMGPVTVQPSP